MWRLWSGLESFESIMKRNIYTVLRQPGNSQSAAPVTKSAFQGSESAALARKSAVR